MQNFNIVKNSDIDVTYRVSKIMNDFDVDPKHTKETFIGNIKYPDDWKIGVIVGGSGTGKTTIAKELYGDKIIDNFKYTAKSVIDDMPSNDVNEITKMFYTVGFGSVPSWLKPFNVLSQGEQMRVNLARKLLQDDFVVFDEFTSVVDRQVAKTMCMALNKSINRLERKQFVAITPHYDVLEYLQPDWVFDINTMKQDFHFAHVKQKNLQFESVTEPSGLNLASIII